MLILNISQVGDGEKTKRVLGRQRSTVNSLVTVPREAAWVQQGGGWVGVCSKTSLTVCLQRQVSASDCCQGSWTGLQGRVNRRYAASWVSLTSRGLQHPAAAANKHRQVKLWTAGSAGACFRGREGRDCSLGALGSIA